MIGALFALLSMDVTERLVAAGLRAPGAFAFSIVMATATTPIIVTTGAPHNVTTPIHAVVADVDGLDGINGTWELTRVDATRLSLGTYSPSGRPVPSSGTGAYAGGGTITSALDTGRIRVGRKWRTVNGVPFRITVVPMGSGRFGLDPYGGNVVPLLQLPSTLSQEPEEDHRRAQQPQIFTDPTRYTVYCLGALNPPDPDFGDYDLALALRDQMIASMFRLMPATFNVLGGKWESQDPSAPTWDSRGQECSFVLEILQPVRMEPAAFVPFGLNARLDVNLSDGPSSDAIIIELPPVEG